MGFFTKRSEIEKLIDADGIDHATSRFAEILAEMLKSREIAHQFVLEEIEAASQGNEVARKFARNSGIEPQEYEGAMQNSRPEVDGDGGPQQMLVAFSLQLRSDLDLMVKFRTMIVDKIMKEFRLGKHGDLVDDDASWADALIAWAEENELPPMAAYDAPAYRLTGFPRTQREIVSLEYLHLPDCFVLDLPREIGKLEHLKAICLDNNGLSELPPEIGSLTNLVRLDLDDNFISTLPKEIGNLANLRVLSLENNPIEDFPIEMTRLGNLRELNVRGADIHLQSKYSPLSSDGFAVYSHFREIIKQDRLSTWLENTDTSDLKITG